MLAIDGNSRPVSKVTTGMVSRVARQKDKPHGSPAARLIRLTVVIGQYTGGHLFTRFTTATNIEVTVGISRHAQAYTT